MILGVNTVLFKKYSLREAMAAAKLAGYGGIEIAAIQGMCEHLTLDAWQAEAEGVRAMAQEYGLALLSMEVASLDAERLSKAFAAAQAIGIPIVNVGPGGKADSEEDLLQAIETLQARALHAAAYGVTLCVKAHVGAAIYNTPTTLRAMREISNASFGIDMDPSHIYRAGEAPEHALAAVVNRVKHIHIRDCKGPGPAPGLPELQACGRGDIDLPAYFKVLVEANYQGPVCLEVIGPDQEMTGAIAIASESYGYMNACLKSLGTR
ncbi:MAG: sugar phosphate isomerase/epimerase [Clostridia bacterium]|nr:sugar phosphate isomerase/epimerase [Clostridia bacterium]